jgi:DNA excision repair protein ERCC-3
MQKNPLIVQSDRTVLAEVDSPFYEEARNRLCRFAELVKSPEHIHTYRISDLSIWNAAASGMPFSDISKTLHDYSRYPAPEHMLMDMERVYARYGQVRLRPGPDPTRLVLDILDDFVRAQVSQDKALAPMLIEKMGGQSFAIWSKDRGPIKQMFIKKGYPVEDIAGYIKGESCPITLRQQTSGGVMFELRDYQREAVEIFYQSGAAKGGNGVIVLPCGSGKTVVGLSAMARLGMQTLIVVTSVAAVRQWIREILDKTDLKPEQVGEYTGEAKQLRPVTVATYNILTYAKNGKAEYRYFDLFNAANWGLIIYDEVHLLPAPLFRMTAELQARRRLGLTATLVREDGHEDDVFALIGPKRYETPWKELEGKGWIAEAVCHEIRVALPEAEKFKYAIAEGRAKFRQAAENSAKIDVIESLLNKHPKEPTLIIGQYLDQLQKVAAHFQLPVITGQTPNNKREKLYKEFRDGELPAIVVSKVANFSIDLPDARILIEISGAFGSRQEEAQRLGRILRPKSGNEVAHFYTVVSANTEEQEYARHRQLFLAEQGYKYQIESHASS